MTHHNCLICSRIQAVQEHYNPYFVKELTTGYVVFGDYQFYQGYTLFLCKQHEPELHLLDPDFRKQFLWEMSQVAEAVIETFNPAKLNYELLGNKDAHMHWHLYPRYKNDPDPNRPIWSLDKSIRVNEKTKITDQFLEQWKPKLLLQLEKISRE